MTEPNEKSVFLAALELADGNERAAYLNKACGGNSLFRKRIEALLVEHERSGQFLDIPVLDQLAVEQDSAGSEVTITTQGSGNQPAPVDLSFLEHSELPDSIGKLGHYEIRSLIGRGGCGIVLKAFDTKLERIVAIKVMYPELASTSPARKRFLREARATAAIRHKNVVSIYAVEEQPLPYLVMELIDGPTLQQKINAIGPLELADILEIAQQAAAGLAAAHTKGLIHRDIKPANILLEGNSNEVKLTDFGLARSADDASITQSGVISGTPLYMSPEQAQGEEIDARSDLFSLGSVLYVMSSGRPPFRAKTTLAVLRRVVEDQPRPIQQIIPEVPNWLVTIIDILLSKEADRRFSSAKEVAALLQKCHDALSHHRTIRLPPEVLKKVHAKPPEGAITHPNRKKQRLAIAAGLAALIAVFALAISTGKDRSPSPVYLVDPPQQSPATAIKQTSEKAKSPASDRVSQKLAAQEKQSDEHKKALAQQQPTYTDRSSEQFGNGVWINDGDEFVQAKPEAASIFFGDPAWTDYDVSVEMKTISRGPRSQGGSLFIRATDDGNRYSFTPGNYNNQGMDLAYRHQGRFGRDGTYRPGTFENNRWYLMRAEVRGKSIRVWLDNELTFETTNDHFPSGRIGLATWNSIVRWRNLTVTDPDGKLLWRGFPEGDTQTVQDLESIAIGSWAPLLRTQEEFDQVVAASPKVNESENAYAKFIDGTTQLHAKNLYFTNFIARNAIIRAKVRKVEGLWGGFYLRSGEQHIAAYTDDGQKFHVWLFDGERHIKLADFQSKSLPEDFVDMAFATIDDAILVFVDGKQIYHGTDPRATNFAGIPAIRASHAVPRSTLQFKDIEIMTLDPLLSPTEREQIDAIQWACLHGAKMNVVINDEYVSFSSQRMPITPPPVALSDFDMREMTDINPDTVQQLVHLPHVHRVFNAPPGADDALLLQLLHTPGINFASHFDIRDTEVTDDFFENLRDMPNLFGICFNNTQVSSKALSHLLDLNNRGVMAENCVNIDDEACEILASRPRWLWLTLAGTSITDEGLEKLAVCDKLDSLDIRNCQVSPEAIQQLSDALPKTTIIWDGGTFSPKTDNSSVYTNSLGMQFAFIPRGKAWLGGGSGQVGTQEVVFSSDFYLGTTEVTQAQWQAVMGHNPSYFKTSERPDGKRWPGADAVKHLTKEELEKLPVEMVSWIDIQKFLAKLNADTAEQGWTYRLPTEIEWEYACRNGPMQSQAESAFSYYFAEGTNELGLDQANVGNQLARSQVVGSYAPNKLGLYDMHGNLYEWCRDTVTDRHGRLCHPARGGGYFLGADQNRATKRNLDLPDFRNYLSGFRVARVPLESRLNPIED